MKNKCKLLGFAVVIAVIVFSAALLFTGCDYTPKYNNGDDDDNGGKGGGGRTFTSSYDFGEWLSKQPDNTPDTAYNVKLNVDYLDIRLYEKKYVILDLSGSTFYYCYSITGIILPNTVKTIEEGAFYDCKNIRSVSLSSNLETIGKDAFLSCTALTSITIPNSVKTIEESAFRGCEGLTSVTIPGSVTSIGWCAFHLCTNLTSVTFGQGTKISDGSSFGGFDSTDFSTLFPGGISLVNLYKTEAQSSNAAGTYIRQPNSADWTKP